MAKKILKGVTSIFPLGALAIGSKLLSHKKKPAVAATTPTERVMPIADDEAVKRAQRQSILRQRGRTGRSSTILTGGSDGGTLGG